MKCAECTQTKHREELSEDANGELLCKGCIQPAGINSDGADVQDTTQSKLAEGATVIVNDEDDAGSDMTEHADYASDSGAA